MIKPIYLYGEEVLRNKSEDVDLNDPDLPNLINDLFDTMHNAKGAGLAAPQIGINKKILVIEEELNDGLFKGVFINPKILNYSGYLIEFLEGCLSFPGMEGRTHRPMKIDIEWYDENKKYHREEFVGTQAIILQHEVDHLNGTLYIDKIYPEEKLKLYKVLENIRKKNVKVEYEIK